jgi:SAM-dependent methyltransferase
LAPTADPDALRLFYEERYSRTRAPYSDGAFSLVFSLHVLEHVLDLQQTLDDIARLVAPQGSVCLILPCGNEGSCVSGAVADRPRAPRRARGDDYGTGAKAAVARLQRPAAPILAPIVHANRAPGTNGVARTPP